MVYLEDLPDEILLLIYRYLNCIDILYAFTDLNKRIERTLLEYKQHINLQYISFKQFNFFIQSVPTLKDNVLSLVVDDEWTDGIPLWYAALALPQLKKLSIISFNMANPKSFLDCVNLLMLEDLHVGRQAMPLLTDDNGKPSTFLHEIRQLKHVNLGEFLISFPNGVYGVDNSIEHMTIKVEAAAVLLTILRFSPCLRYLKCSMLYEDGCAKKMDIHLPYLHEVHLSTTDLDDWIWSTIVTIMQCLPSTLKRFSFEGAAGFQSQWLDGNAWAQSLPTNVESFQLLLKAYYGDFFRLDIPSEQVKDSWSTSFWINEKHCYMQCFDVKSLQTHFLLCTHDCSGFDSFDNSMDDAKHVFSVKPDGNEPIFKFKIERFSIFL
jgi:hypothetical protein